MPHGSPLLPAAPRRRVLVVDDMPDNLFLMHGLLEDRCEVLQARSGLEALDAASASPRPSLVLLDIMMPGMDGYEVLRRMRQDPFMARIPVVFLTSLSSTHDVRLGLDLGAAGYLTKPIDPQKVLDCVDTHLRTQEAAATGAGH